MEASVMMANGPVLEGDPPRESLASGPAAFFEKLGEDGWQGPGRAEAWERFAALPMPTRTDEAWRFSSAHALEVAAYHPPLPVSSEARESLLAKSRGLAASAGRMVFANDQLLTHEVAGSDLRQQGVQWLPLARAARELPELFRSYFMREEAILGSQKFAALHQAWVTNGSFLRVPRNTRVELPLEAFHWLHGDGGSCFPHTLIVAEENSEVTFIDYFASHHPETRGYACGVNDLWLGKGARVTYVNLQQWSRQAVAVQVNSTIVGPDASAIALNANFGGSFLRSESLSHLRAAGGRSDMLAFAIADGQRQVDQRTLQIHEAPHTSSDLLYKNALDDQARTTFAGLIRVAPGAHFTDAYQKVRNLLLSDDAEANSAPGLEIEADNVRCTHGATSGQVDDEELFYLLSRGIPRRVAQRLIVFGFLNEVLDRLPSEAIREKLRLLLQERTVQ